MCEGCGQRAWAPVLPGAHRFSCPTWKRERALPRGSCDWVVHRTVSYIWWFLAMAAAGSTIIMIRSWPENILIDYIRPQMSPESDTFSKWQWACSEQWLLSPCVRLCVQLAAYDSENCVNTRFPLASWTMRQSADLVAQRLCSLNAVPRVQEQKNAETVLCSAYRPCPFDQGRTASHLWLFRTWDIHWDSTYSRQSHWASNVSTYSNNVT